MRWSATPEALDSGYGNPWHRKLAGEIAARRPSVRILWLTLLLGLVGFFLLACGNGGDTSTNPSAGNGMLAVEMKDQPTEELSELNVYIVGLTVKPVGEPVVRIANEVGPVDLLELRTRTELLVMTELEPAQYEYIRVDLDQDRSYVVELATGAQLPLQIASEEIKVQGGFEVFAADTTHLTLDFDAEQSLRKRGNGSWLLVPVIIQEEVVVED